MALITKGIRGTQDILPRDSYKWQVIEGVMLGEARVHGFKEIRVPVFEHTELFTRSVGENSDVVQKEMYTFNDKGGRSITLRPEVTASTVRAMLEHGLYNEGLPVKTCYIATCYRYEKPQAGRYREFHQFGVEMFGTSSPAADAEIISLAKSVFDRLGVTGISLEINSIGCPKCRGKYYEALKQYFKEHVDELCPTCRERLERNPMRILDCKSPVCSEIAKNAPVVLDYICEECSEHFDGVKQYLDSAGIEYKINPKIVRGLDYYTKTVFEFVCGEIGAQSTVCGGGRYDGLVAEIGGQDMPSLGFGMGMERLLLTMENQGIKIEDESGCDIYIAAIGTAGQLEAFNLVRQIRQASLIAESDVVGRSLKAQMKYADKIGAKFSMVLGDDEIKNGSAKIKNMKTGEQTEISLTNNFMEEFFSLLLKYDEE